MTREELIDQLQQMTGDRVVVEVWDHYNERWGVVDLGVVLDMKGIVLLSPENYVEDLDMIEPNPNEEIGGWDQ